MPQASYNSDEYIVVGNTAISETVGLSPLQAPAWLNQIAALALLGGMVLLPLAFGAVHPLFYLSARMAAFALFAAFLLAAPRLAIALIARASFTRTLLAGGLLFVLYAAVQMLILNASAQPHPVLGFASQLPNRRAAWSAINELLFFLSIFCVIRLWLAAAPRRAPMLVWAVLASSLLIGLVALSHWFYDNGRLFWTFEPEHIFVSSRARWPFVNANHLGHFMLPAFFLLTALVINLADSLRQMLAPPGQPPGTKLKWPLASKRFQSKIIQILLTATAMLCVLLCIAGSLSRSAWLGLGLGLIALAVSPRRGGSHKPASSGMEKEEAVSSVTEGAPAGPSCTADNNEAIEVSPRLSWANRKRPTQRRRSYRKTEMHLPLTLWLQRAAKPLVLAAAALVFYFFIQGRGAELIETRIDYGLAYSVDDMRWQLYADTLPMIEDHWLIGVGLGQWPAHYPRYMDRRLSGIQPGFLHSDPLQLTAETGLIGVLVLIALLIALGRQTTRLLPNFASPERTLARGLLIGICSLAAASCLDFPFHIPAILFYCALYFALFAHFLEHSQNGVSGKPAKYMQS